MRKYRKFLVVAGALVALAVPSIASADQPARPGCFGQARAAWIHANSGAEWGAIASQRAGDNSAINAEYKALYCS
jgi:hypothetical protein